LFGFKTQSFLPAHIGKSKPPPHALRFVPSTKNALKVPGKPGFCRLQKLSAFAIALAPVKVPSFKKSHL